ncbi:MAG: molybdopterin-dependent oxidoreductase [Methanocellales archaeon]|nr:molybdopterin-dependent oxidoreductase [Methanocellales archaeon]
MRKKILVVVLVIFFIGCIQKPITLEEIEIRDYEGQKLSSVEDFRENSIKGPQYIDKESYNLEISGLVENPKMYSYDDVINNYQHYQQVVTLDCVEGWSVKIFWEGVLVRDMIKQSDPLPNATTVIFYAYDGYTTSFPLEYIMDNDIIMAYKMNNVTLTPERGFPFQLVAQSKWGYKWIKWITKIELSNNPDYRGYWEKRGYSNTGNLNESFF